MLECSIPSRSASLSTRTARTRGAEASLLQARDAEAAQEAWRVARIVRLCWLAAAAEPLHVRSRLSAAAVAQPDLDESAPHVGTLKSDSARTLAFLPLLISLTCSPLPRHPDILRLVSR
jgi:hypothetical protein